MMIIAKCLASWFGIGYIQKGAGTIAALFCCLLWWVGKIDQSGIGLQVLLISFCFFIGVWVSTIVENHWGHDSNRIVIDEVLGMGIGLLLLPFSLLHFSTAFILFRFFDIAKPLGVRRMEKLPKGWGVMCDDLLAGIYTFVLMQLIIKLQLF